jgi:hypothetical protein
MIYDITTLLKKKNQAYISGDSDWYSRPYIFFILRKKYTKPYTVWQLLME